MKYILLIIIVFPLLLNAQESTTEKENSETILWLMEKINLYCKKPLLFNSPCHSVYSDFSISYATEEYIETSFWDSNGLHFDDLDKCTLRREQKMYFEEVIGFEVSSGCVLLYKYRNYDEPINITFPTLDPEPDFYKRLLRALNDLVDQNKILYPTAKEKY